MAEVTSRYKDFWLDHFNNYIHTEYLKESNNALIKANLDLVKKNKELNNIGTKKLGTPQTKN